MGTVREIAGRWKWLGIATFALILFAPSSQKAARADTPIDGLAYQIHAVYQPASGPAITTTTDAYQDVPALVDVDRDLTTGVAGAEFIAQVTIDAGRATLRVLETPGTPALKVKIFATLPDPRQGLPLPLLGQPDDRLRIDFGYDALNSQSPSVFTATAAIAGADRISSFSLDLNTVSPGPTLGVFGEVYTLGSNDEHVDPISARVDYTPVPAAAHFSVLEGRDIGPGVGAGQASIDLTTDLPCVVDVKIDDVQGQHLAETTAHIDQLPNSLSIIQNSVEGTGQQTFTYSASARVADLSLRSTDSNDLGQTLTQDALLHLEDMALNATIVQDSPTHETFQADSPIGVVLTGLASHGAAQYLNDPAYMYLFDDGTVSSLAFQVRGLSHADITSGDPFSIQADLQSGPFRILSVDHSQRIDGQIRNLPSSVTLSGSFVNGTLDLQGNAPIDEIRLDASDPTGLFGSRATSGFLDLLAVPTHLTFQFSQNAGQVSLNAHDQTIGSLEFLLTSGPQDELDPQFDGVWLEDHADRFVISARATKLRRVAAIISGSVSGLDFDSDSTKVMKLLLDTRNSHGDENYVHATLDHLVPGISLRFDSAQSTITYSGAAVVNSIVVDAYDPAGLVNRAKTGHIDLEQVPTSLTFSFGSSSSGIAIDAGGSTLGSIEALLTSGPDERLPDGVDGVLLHNMPDKYVLFGRVTALKKVGASQDSTGKIDFLMDTGSSHVFEADLQQPNTQGHIATINAVIDHLVPAIDVAYDPANGSITYSGGATVDKITLDVIDPDGLTGRVTHANLRLDSVPTGLNMSFGGSSSGAVIDAKGSTLGLFQALLAADPQATAPIAGDGLILHDTQAEYLVYAHVTSLKKVAASQGSDGAIGLTLDTGSTQVFPIDIQQPNSHGNPAYIKATIDHLVPAINVTYTPSTGAISYSGGATVSSIVIDVYDPDGVVGRAKRAQINLASVPNGLDMTFGLTSGVTTIDAKGATLGLFYVKLSSDPNAADPLSDDGMVVHDTPLEYMVYARVDGLKKVTVAAGTGGTQPGVTLQTTGGHPFVLDVAQQKSTGIATLHAEILNLVPTVTLNFTSATTFTYSASDPVGSITMTAYDPDGVAGRATNAQVTLQGLPHKFDVTFDPSGQVNISAYGETLDLLQLMLTSSSLIDDSATIGANDGILLEDLPAKFFVFVRMTKILSAQTQVPTLKIDSSGGKKFQVELDSYDTQAAKTVYIKATIDSLVRHMSLGVIDTPTASKIVYSADAPTNTISFDTNSGTRYNAHYDLAPVPTWFDLCQASSNESCSNRPSSDARPRDANNGSTSFHASNWTTINAFDCITPATSACPGSPSKYVRISNWRVRFFEQESGGTASSIVVSSGYIWENTTDHGTGCAAAPQASDTGACHYRITSGVITARDGSSGVQQNFGTGNFWMDQHQGSWNCLFVFFCSNSQTNTFFDCSGGSLTVWLFGFNIDVTGYLC